MKYHSEALFIHNNSCMLKNIVEVCMLSSCLQKLVISAIFPAEYCTILRRFNFLHQLLLDEHCMLHPYILADWNLTISLIIWQCHRTVFTLEACCKLIIHGTDSMVCQQVCDLVLSNIVFNTRVEALMIKNWALVHFMVFKFSGIFQFTIGKSLVCCLYALCSYWFLFSQKHWLH